MVAAAVITFQGRRPEGGGSRNGAVYPWISMEGDVTRSNYFLIVDVCSFHYLG
jgi:hypothetical protein